MASVSEADPDVQAVEEAAEETEESEEGESSDASTEGGAGLGLILLWVGAAIASAFGTKFALAQTLGEPNDLEGTIQSIERGDLRISTGRSDNLVFESKISSMRHSKACGR